MATIYSGYRVGTIDLTNGSAAFTGTLTGWLGMVQEGDLLKVVAGGANWFEEIDAITSNTAGTLKAPWQGPTGAHSYVILRYSPLWDSVSVLSLRLADAVSRAVRLIRTTGKPAPEVGGDGVLAVDRAAQVFYFNTNGVWDDGVSFKGDPGVDGELTRYGSVTVGNVVVWQSNTQVKNGPALATSTTAGRLAKYSNTSGSQEQTVGIFEDASGNAGFGTASPWAKVSLPFSGKASFGTSVYNFNVYKVASGTLDVFFDSVDTDINTRVRFRMTTNGTPLDALTINGSGNATLKGNDTSGNRNAPFDVLTLATINPSAPYGITSTGFGPAIAFRSMSYDGAEYVGARVSGQIGDSSSSTVGMSLSFSTSTTRGGSVNERMRIAASGAVRLNTYGAGTLTTDASGNITASSDEALKDDIQPFTLGLPEILQINPISYLWSAASGLDRMNRYCGFSAQNVETAVPEAVGVDANGYLTLTEKPILAALVNAVKGLSEQNAALAARIEALEQGA